MVRYLRRLIITGCSILIMVGILISILNITVTGSEILPAESSITIEEKHLVSELDLNLVTINSNLEKQTLKKEENKEEPIVFLVFNEKTYRIHRSDCIYYDDTMKKIEGNYVECGRKCSYCNPDVTIGTIYTEPNPEKTYVKTFSRGTYYTGGSVGGSGRCLIDCSYGDGNVKGSIASSYLYNIYGYNHNGNRTKVFLEIKEYPQMNGYYYLDDCDAGNPNVIDFYYVYSGNCLFKQQGVITVDCYIVN